MRTDFSERFSSGLLQSLSKGTFDEAKHPRGRGGKFARKGSVGGPSPKPQEESAPKPPPDQPTVPTPEEIDAIFEKRQRRVIPDTFEQAKQMAAQRQEGEKRIEKMSWGAEFPYGITEDIAKVSPKAEAVVRALGEKIRKEGEQRGIEFVFAVDNETGAPVGLAEGEKASAPTWPMGLLMDTKRGYTVVHNHPHTGSSFSNMDLMSFIRLPQFVRFVVESSEYRYTIEKPVDWDIRRQGGAEAFFRTYDRRRTELNEKYAPPANPDGTRDQQRDWAAWREQSNELNSDVAREWGLVYKREPK